MPIPASAIDNILDSVKNGVGIQTTDETFDGPIINHINSVMMILNQMGVGPTAVFVVDESGDQLWTDFLAGGSDELLAAVKSYTILKVQSMFDPPTSGVVTTALKETLESLESRLLYQVETQ